MGPRVGWQHLLYSGEIAPDARAVSRWLHFGVFDTRGGGDSGCRVAIVLYKGAIWSTHTSYNIIELMQNKNNPTETKDAQLLVRQGEVRLSDKFTSTPFSPR